MKAFYLTLSLLFVSMDSHAGLCYLPEPNLESPQNFFDSVETIIERTEKDVGLVLTIPSEMDEHELDNVTLLIINEINDQQEFLVPVATDESLDGKSNKLFLLLTLNIFERAVLDVTYGRCRLWYRLNLQELGDQSQVPKSK